MYNQYRCDVNSESLYDSIKAYYDNLRDPIICKPISIMFFRLKI